MEITDPKDMVTHIMAENDSKFHQTKDWSELHLPEIIDDLGFLGEGPAVDEVLSGTYTSPVELSSYTESWLHNMKLPSFSAPATKTSLQS